MGKDWFEKQFSGFVSPFLRTLKTAVPLQQCGIPFLVDHRIAEAPDAAYKNLELSDVVSRSKNFPQYNWSQFPANGISQEVRTMENYWIGLDDFIKSLPEYSIVVTHMSPIKDIVEKVIKKTDGAILNGSVTYIENGKLIFHGRT